MLTAQLRHRNLHINNNQTQLFDVKLAARMSHIIYINNLLSYCKFVFLNLKLLAICSVYCLEILKPDDRSIESC